jgi:hypothetical protein
MSFLGIDASSKIYPSFRGSPKNSTVFRHEKKLDLGKDASNPNS